jgi:sterol desaturase/sphingolipid hydroxylase (fatty acid hydroxylase superfamily)
VESLHPAVTLASIAGLVWTACFFEVAMRYAVSGILLVGLIRVARGVRALRLQSRSCRDVERRRDILASLGFATIAATLTIPVAAAQSIGWTQIYASVDGHGYGRILEWLYLPASFVILLIIHDAYFYWTHRLLHWRPLFKIAHARHHESHTPTVWTAFAFHPIESVIQALIYPLLAFCVPVHQGVVAIFLIYTALHSAIIHCGHDLILGGSRGWVSRLVYSTFDHDAHHRRGRGGYALYFGWWDTCMRTRVDTAVADRVSPGGPLAMRGSSG